MEKQEHNSGNVSRATKPALCTWAINSRKLFVLLFLNEGLYRPSVTVSFVNCNIVSMHFSKLCSLRHGVILTWSELFISND